MTQAAGFEVTEHGGIDPLSESSRFVAKHLSAYEFARPFAQGKVLEVGCGDGYGSSLLAKTANEVTAVDLFPKNVTAAAERYAGPNLRFLQMNATELAFEDETFDLVVSFQVIEHIPQALLGRYVSEIRRVLKPGGVFIVTTLNLSKAMKPGARYEKSPHHDKEFRPEELEAFLREAFPRVEMFGLYPGAQHRVYERLKKWGLFRMMPAGLNPVERFYKNITPADFSWQTRPDLGGCEDILGLCRKKT